ncbi:protein GVQW3-like [Schistocerca serialis cubense]|uniref:protein GVQW3-like n=1 Tax=Schistocerca serialis cubense TaxID=2023355 RepID=UPI00214E5F06|nr:protein GVQW3-like [Schistocerca serialis cubense]
MKSASRAVCKHAHAMLRLSVFAWQPLRTELPLDVTAKCELRTVIQFLDAKGTALIEIHHQLTEVFGELCMNVKNVRMWCREFAAGRTEIHDQQRSGRPTISEETVLKVERSTCEDWHITLNDLCTLVPEVSRSTNHRILTETLNYWKMCARWVPRMLTEDLMQK